MARSPLRDGWRVLMRAPESILAEIAWRWVFGAAFWGLLFLSFHQYFSHIEISRAEYALLKSFEPFTWVAIAARVLTAFLQGVRAMGPILFPALAILWLALATIGRGFTVRALATETQGTNWLSLVGLNAVRLVMGIACLFAYFGAAILVARWLGSQHLALNALVLLLVIFVLGSVWSVVNWFASLAQIFAAMRGEGLVRSLQSANALYHEHSGLFTSSGIAFGVFRLILIAIVTFGSLSPVANVSAGGVRTLIVFLAIISLAYFAIADALNMWRLGVYISLTEPAAIEPIPQPLPPPPPAPTVVTQDDTESIPPPEPQSTVDSLVEPLPSPEPEPPPSQEEIENRNS